MSGVVVSVVDFTSGDWCYGKISCMFYRFLTHFIEFDQTITFQELWWNKQIYRQTKRKFSKLKLGAHFNQQNSPKHRIWYHRIPDLQTILGQHKAEIHTTLLTYDLVWSNCWSQNLEDKVKIHTEKNPPKKSRKTSVLKWCTHAQLILKLSSVFLFLRSLIKSAVFSFVSSVDYIRAAFFPKTFFLLSSIFFFQSTLFDY